MAEKFVPSMEQLFDLYKQKLEKGGILPPDPARVAEFVLRIPVTIEHVLPIPPVLEYIHSHFTEPMVQSLPRFPMTMDFPEYKYLEWLPESLNL